MIKGRFVWVILGAFVVLSGCKKDDDVVACPEPGIIAVPDTYAFIDADGNSTVSINGQAQRLEMLSEMSAYLTTGNTPGTALDAQTLLDMYANNGHSWADVENLGMTGSSKQLKNKTAAASGVEDPTVQAYFEVILTQVADLSATTLTDETTGGPGMGGVVLSTSNPDKQYLQNASGHEYTQLFEKGLMGAVFYHQIAVGYLGESKMDVENTAAVDPDNEQYFTVMEHHWDEAYGYFTTATDYPDAGTDRFWGKYAEGREAVLGSSTTLSAAFRRGRAAISAGNLDLRDAQIAIIRTELELVAGGTAIHYLNSAASNFTDHALRNHALSEAWAFMEALPYGHNPAVNSAELLTLKNGMGDDFYAVTAVQLIEVRNALAAALGLEDFQDAL